MCFLRMHSKQTCSYSNESSSSEIGEETRDNLKNNHSLNEKLSKKPENPTNLFLYMQMELCDKGTLRDIIDNEQLYHKPTRYWEMLRQMTAGLGYLHLQNICHRDLKPRNVMISTDNKIKLGDFGLATENSSRIVEKDQNIGENGKFEDKNMSVGNSISDFAFDFEKSEALDFESEKTKNVGTMLYIAPEIRITGKYTDKVDMYSLGICFYEMCSEDAAAGGQSRLIAIQKARQKDWCSDKLGSSKTGGIEDIQTGPELNLIKNLLNHDSNIRKSAKEVLDEFIPDEYLEKRKILPEELKEAVMENFENQPLRTVEAVFEAFSNITELDKRAKSSFGTLTPMEQHNLETVQDDLDSNNHGSSSFNEICENVSRFFKKRGYGRFLSSMKYDYEVFKSGVGGLNSGAVIDSNGLCRFEEKDYLVNFAVWNSYREALLNEKGSYEKSRVFQSFYSLKTESVNTDSSSRIGQKFTNLLVLNSVCSNFQQTTQLLILDVLEFVHSTKKNAQQLTIKVGHKHILRGWIISELGRRKIPSSLADGLIKDIYSDFISHVNNETTFSTYINRQVDDDSKRLEHSFGAELFRFLNETFSDAFELNNYLANKTKTESSTNSRTEKLILDGVREVKYVLNSLHELGLHDINFEIKPSLVGVSSEKPELRIIQSCDGFHFIVGSYDSKKKFKCIAAGGKLDNSGHSIGQPSVVGVTVKLPVKAVISFKSNEFLPKLLNTPVISIIQESCTDLMFNRIYELRNSLNSRFLTQVRIIFDRISVVDDKKYEKKNSLKDKRYLPICISFKNENLVDIYTDTGIQHKSVELNHVKEVSISFKTRAEWLSATDVQRKRSDSLTISEHIETESTQKHQSPLEYWLDTIVNTIEELNFEATNNDSKRMNVENPNILIRHNVEISMIDSHGSKITKSGKRAKIQAEKSMRHKFSQEKFLSGFSKGLTVHVFGVELEDEVLKDLGTQFNDENDDKDSKGFGYADGNYGDKSSEKMCFSSKTRRYLGSISDEILMVMRNDKESSNIFVICSYDESCSGSLPYRLFSYWK